MTQPALLVNSLLPRVIESYRSGKVSDFTLARYEEDARKIMQQSPPNGEMMMGMIAGLRHDAEAVNQHYQAAVALANDFVIHINFTNAFQYAYDYKSAKKAVEAALSTLNHSDPFDSKAVSSLAFAYGQIDEAVDLQRKLARIKGGEFDGGFLEMIQKLQAAAVPHLQDLLMVVYDVLSRHKLIATRHSLTRILLDGENAFFSEYVIYVMEGSAAKLAQYQQEADAALVAYEETHHLEPTPIGFRLARSVPA